MKTRKLTEADVTAESVFNLQRRQVLKMLGIGATAMSALNEGPCRPARLV